MDLSKPKYAIAGVLGAGLAITALADMVHTHFTVATNRSACDMQALDKVSATAGVSSNGTVSYDHQTEMCRYTYSAPDGSTKTLEWEPSP